MANRVTVEEVKEIIDLSNDTTDPTINAMIISANILVDETISSDGLSASHLKEIERWLSAHFLAIRDPRYTESELGDARVKYETAKMGEGLKATKYGQQVLVLDTTGKFLDFGKRDATIEAIA